MLEIYPAEVWNELGPLVIDALDQRGLDTLVEACPNGEPAAVVACFTENRKARHVLERASERARRRLIKIFGRTVTDALGDELLPLSVEQLGSLAGACPQSSRKERIECLRSQLAGGGAAATAETGAHEYPAEALELFPREALDQLPELITTFLRADDYRVMKEKCPQQEIAEILACFQGEEVADLLDTMASNGVIASMLEYMDVELPNRLTPENFDALSERCNTVGETWATCADEHGAESEDCADQEQALAECLVDNDLVSEKYLAIAEEKKAIFGKELYVEFAGLMAVLPIDAIKALRQDCPQTDMEAAAECFQNHEAVGEIIGVYYELAKEVVTETAQELAALGKELDVDAYTEQVTSLFLRLPSHAIKSLAAACEKKYPELENPQDPSDLDKALACIEEAGQTNPVANPAYISPEKLRKWLGVARTKVVDVISKKEEAKQGKSFHRILIVLLGLAVLGFLVVLWMPLFLAKKYPGQSKLLWRASAVAAVTFAATVVMLGAALLAMRTAQGAVARDSTSPKMRIAQGAFDVLEKDEYVEGFSDLSKMRLDFVKGPLRNIVRATQDAALAAEYSVFVAYVAGHWVELLNEPELKPLAKNAAKLEAHAASYKTVIAGYKKVDWIMGQVPVALSLLAVFLYLLPLKDTLVDIASAPARAARGAAVSGATVRRAMTTVWAEVKSVVPFIALILVLLPLIGVFLSVTVQPLIELLLGFSLLTLFYLLLTEASTWVLYASLGSVIVLLVACLAVYIVSMVFFTGKVRKILRSIFHFGHSFSEYNRFWFWGSIGLLWLLVLPVLYVWGVDYVVTEYYDPNIDALSTADMLWIPLPSLLLFPVLLWIARGTKALSFIKKYPVQVKSDPSLALAAADVADHAH